LALVVGVEDEIVEEVVNDLDLLFWHLLFPLSRATIWVSVSVVLLDTPQLCSLQIITYSM